MPILHEERRARVIAIRPVHDRWLWLHRVGYLTTAIVAVELAFIGYLAGAEWLHRYRVETRAIEVSRTHAGPLRTDGTEYARGRAIDFLRPLPSLQSMPGDGLRFVAIPSFGSIDYGVIISRGKTGREKVNAVLIGVGDDPSGSFERHFTIPQAEYDRFAVQFDALVDGWPGDIYDAGCLDGTITAFERKRGGKVSSGIGNCSPHYQEIRRLMRDIVSRFAPGKDVPTTDAWMLGIKGR